MPDPPDLIRGRHDSFEVGHDNGDSASISALARRLQRQPGVLAQRVEVDFRKALLGAAFLFLPAMLVALRMPEPKAEGPN